MKKHPARRKSTTAVKSLERNTGALHCVLFLAGRFFARIFPHANIFVLGMCLHVCNRRTKRHTIKNIVTISLNKKRELSTLACGGGCGNMQETTAASLVSLLFPRSDRVDEGSHFSLLPTPSPRGAITWCAGIWKTPAATWTKAISAARFSRQQRFSECQARWDKLRYLYRREGSRAAHL